MPGGETVVKVLTRVGVNDPEVAAALAIVEALEPLDEYARNRVLNWSFDRFFWADPEVKVDLNDEE